jgi:hypothetical protein
VSGVRRASFVVRLVRDGRGTVSGVIERVATGAKEAFHGLEAIGPTIGRMAESQPAATRSAGQDSRSRDAAPP